MRPSSLVPPSNGGGKLPLVFGVVLFSARSTADRCPAVAFESDPAFHSDALARVAWTDQTIRRPCEESVPHESLANWIAVDLRAAVIACPSIPALSSRPQV